MNYSLWALKMKALSIWSATKEFNQLANEGVFAALSQSVPDHVDDVGCNYGTAEEAWKPIRCVLISEE